MKANIKTIWIGWTILIFFGFGLAVLGKDPKVTNSETAYIKSIVGNAKVRSSDSGKWRTAYVGMPVKMHWEICTSIESSCELVIHNGLIITLSENSVVRLSGILNEKKQAIAD